ncbi:amidohydrolase family protein [Jongsikchunia kroppenstedtii]|uniref:amidohydrolase family protein n=1 Tax=Jongsikchunia kroppenstedtii TaxID=1121721 RepID=UPI0003715FA3|nr:amidohydrolase family protein [Jongsikchunia kroppenstedtii]
MCDDTTRTVSSADEPQQVRQFAAEAGVPAIIDVHTHFMPRQVMDKVWAYFDSAGPLVGREWPITYRADEAQRVQTLRDFGVAAFTSMVYPHKPGMAAWLNAWATEFAAATPECLHTATFYPEESARDYVPASIAAGARVFKSHIQVGDYQPNDPLLDVVWGTIEDAQVPVVIHCGSGPAPGRYTGPEPIHTLLQRFPRLPLIVAHMGMPEYAEFFALAEEYENVRLDTTMAFTDFANEGAPIPEEAAPALSRLGHKILFGSDFPNIPYRYLHALEAVQRVAPDDDWLAAVIYRNAQALFEITEPAA